MMHAVHSPAILTHEDVTVLQLLLETPDLPDHARSAIRQKLSGACVMPGGSITGDVATMNSRITYQVGDDVPVTAFLVNAPRPLRSFQGIVPLRSPVGLSVLGLREGGRAVIEAPGRPSVTLRLRRVLHQPQRELQAIFGSSASTASWQAEPAAPIRDSSPGDRRYRYGAAR